jgi:hypothetical protein
MQPSEPHVADGEVRRSLISQYRELAAQYPDDRHDCWRDRLAAAISGETLVEPGWMLRRVLGDTIHIYGVYRVYGDGRVERDRFLEREDRERFLRGGSNGEQPTT